MRVIGKQSTINGTIRSKKVLLGMNEIICNSLYQVMLWLSVLSYCVQVVFAVNVLDSKCSPVVVNCV